MDNIYLDKYVASLFYLYFCSFSYKWLTFRKSYTFISPAFRLIENSYLGLENGILDQSAILLSRSGYLTFMDCKVIKYLYLDKNFSITTSLGFMKTILPYTRWKAVGLGTSNHVSICGGICKVYVSATDWDSITFWPYQNWVLNLINKHFWVIFLLFFIISKFQVSKLYCFIDLVCIFFFCSFFIIYFGK